MDQPPAMPPLPPVIPINLPSPKEAHREQLQRVALRQRRLIYVFLANLVCMILPITGAALQQPLLVLLWLPLYLTLVVLSALAIFFLAQEVYSTAVAVVSVVCMILPCVSIIVLLMVNQKATTYLQQHGVKVGFLGVDPKSI